MRTRAFIWCINYESATMEVGNNNTFAANISSTLSPELKELLRKEQERTEFYATYDVMTGVRIAYTLGGFFGLMVLLVVYKSKSKTERALEDPNLAAAAVAEAEEEERQIAAALEATAYEQLNPTKRSRRSLDTSSVSPRWIRNTKRFSSIAGYASLMEPPIRLSSKLPSSIDEDSPTDDCRILYDDIYTTCYEGHLGVGVNVPNRRPSNVTCSSSGSSYLERRGSAVMLGLPPVPGHKHHLQQMRRRQSSPLPEQYDFYYPIDIRVIQPTPGGSPCGSERALYDVVPSPRQHLAPRLAPLASISSCNSSLANDYPDYPDYDMQSHASYCSDSVFRDIECYEDTDDEIDPFSTDSEEEAERAACEEQARVRPCCSQDYHRRVSMALPTSPLSTISDESTSTLIGVCCTQAAGGKDCERCARCLADVGYVDDSVEEDEVIEIEAAPAILQPECKVSRRPSVSSISREMSASATLGALGATLESLERKRDSCCSMEGTPSPTSSLHGAAAPLPQIEVIDVDDPADGESGEQGVWSKETLF